MKGAPLRGHQVSRNLQDYGLAMALADRKRGRCVRAEMDLSPTTRNDARAKDLVEIVSRGSVIKDDRWQ